MTASSGHSVIPTNTRVKRRGVCIKLECTPHGYVLVTSPCPLQHPLHCPIPICPYGLRASPRTAHALPAEGTSTSPHLHRDVLFRVNNRFQLRSAWDGWVSTPGFFLLRLRCLGVSTLPFGGRHR